MTTFDGVKALTRLKSFKAYPAGLCLQAVARALDGGTPTKPGTGIPAAKVVETVNDLWAQVPKTRRHTTTPPKGTVVVLKPKPGAAGRWHVCLSLGGGKIRTTDFPVKGGIADTTIAKLEAGWHYEMVGWTDYFEGVTVTYDKPAAKKPTTPAAPKKPIPKPTPTPAPPAPEPALAPAPVPEPAPVVPDPIVPEEDTMPAPQTITVPVKPVLDEEATAALKAQLAAVQAVADTPAPSEVDAESVAAALGSIIKSPKSRMTIYAVVILAAATVWTTSEVDAAVLNAIAAHLDTLNVWLAGAKAGLGYLLPLLGGLAVANTTAKQ